MEAPARRRGYSRWVQWKNVNASAVILGYVKHGNSVTAQQILKERIRAGEVIKKKYGNADSSPAFYAVKLPRRRR